MQGHTVLSQVVIVNPNLIQKELGPFTGVSVQYPSLLDIKLDTGHELTLIPGHPKGESDRPK